MENQVVYATATTAHDRSGPVWRADSDDWTPPVPVGDPGDLEVIYIRSATKPATPNPSSDIPAGWSNSPDITGTATLWEAWGVRKPGNTLYTWHVRIVDLDELPDRPRGPGLFPVPVTQAEATRLAPFQDAEGTLLTDAPLIAKADAATPQDNVDHDSVFFYRDGFSQLWSWDEEGGDWVRAPGFFSADLIIAGELQALRVSGDLQNYRVLYNSRSGTTITNAIAGTPIDISDELTDYDYLVLDSWGLASSSHAWIQTIVVPIWQIFNSYTSYRFASGVEWYFDIPGRGRIRFWSSATRQLRFVSSHSAASVANDSITLYHIGAIRNPVISTGARNLVPTGGTPPTSDTSPVIADNAGSTTLPQATAGMAYSFQCTLSQQGNSPYEWSLEGGPPSWMAIGRATGLITGTPTAAAASVGFRVRVRDADGDEDTQAFGIVVNAAPVPRLELSTASVNLVEGGSTVRVGIRLTAQPESNVGVTIGESDPDITISPTTMEFSRTNWNVYQYVVIAPVSDPDRVDDTAIVRVNASGRNVSDSAEINVAIRDTTPTPTITAPASAPTGLSHSGTTLRWGSVTGATSYDIFWGPGSTFSAPSSASSADFTSVGTSYTGSGITEGRSYWVRARNSAGAGPWSARYYIAPAPTSPPTPATSPPTPATSPPTPSANRPTNMRLSFTGRTVVNISWDDGVAPFVLRVQSFGSTPAYDESFTTSSRVVTVSGLTADSLYTAVVLGANNLAASFSFRTNP